MQAGILYLEIRATTNVFNMIYLLSVIALFSNVDEAHIYNVENNMSAYIKLFVIKLSGYLYYK
jgi:hypothetical protein